MEKSGKVKFAVMSLENGHCMSIINGIFHCEFGELVAVSVAPGVRLNEKEAIINTDFAEKGIDVYYDDEEMLKAHPEIEVCAVGGANGSHMRQFRLCAERGINIISMKVPTLNMNEYNEMLALREKYGITVHTELEMRWRASITRIREIIESGVIGEVESFTAYNYSHNPLWWRPWMDIPEASYGRRVPIRPKSKTFRGGALTDHPHVFDIMTYIFGSNIESVYAECAPNMRDFAETEDMVYITGRMQNGVVFSLDPSYANKEKEIPRSTRDLDFVKYPKACQVDIQINGTKGSIIADVYGSDNIETLQPDGVYLVTDYDIKLPVNSNTFIMGIAKCTRNPEKYQPIVDFKAHKKTMQAVDAAYESIYTGEVVKIDYTK